MARLRRTARKSVPGGPYRVEGFQLPEQVVQVMSELAPSKEVFKDTMGYLSVPSRNRY